MIDNKIRCFKYIMHLKMNRKKVVLVFRFFEMFKQTMICKIKNTYLLNPGFERSRLKQCFQILDGLLYLYFSHCQILVYQWISYGINGGLGSKWSSAVSTCSQCINMLLITCMVNSSSTAWCCCSIIHVYCDWSQTDEASIGPSVFLDILTSQSLWSSNRRRIKNKRKVKC